MTTTTTTTTDHPAAPARSQAAAPADALPRPTLLPGLRRLWRGRTTLQLGQDPDRAVILELADPTLARLLDLCDGSRSERAVLHSARRYGITEPTARTLIETLRRAGVLVAGPSLVPSGLSQRARARYANEAAALAMRSDHAAEPPARVLRRRMNARVLVTGYGPVLEPVAVALARAGVGHVCPVVEPVPAVRGQSASWRPPERSGAQVAAAVRQGAPETRTGPLPRPEITFTVRFGTPGPDDRAATPADSPGAAQLSVTVRDATVVVGPLTTPSGTPCQRCIDLHRRDRDPDWPALASQLAAAAHEPCPVATVLCGAGLATAEVLAWLDGGHPTTVGGSLEVAASGAPRRRSWPPHPECACFPAYLRARPG